MILQVTKMTFKLENIKTETVNSEQKITREYVFKENKGLSEDRTFAPLLDSLIDGIISGFCSDKCEHCDYNCPKDCFSY